MATPQREDDDNTEFKAIREGFLLKRGAHPEDVYLKRWISLWPSRIGYTMKVSSGKYCNFIPLEYITEVVPASDWTSDVDKACDFEIHVVPAVEDLGLGDEREIFPCLRESAQELRNHPRPYYLRASDVVERNQWIRDIRKSVRKAKQKMQAQRSRSEFRKLQTWLEKGYSTRYVQTFSSILILTNFVMSAYDAQINPEPGSYEESWLKKLDTFFTAIFTAELAWNMASYWFLNFWMSLWNIFDFVIIVISLLGEFGLLPSGLNVLRALRAIRVFRLFRRLEALKQILISLGYAIKPVASAALFVVLFSSLYAVIGVNFFRDDFDEWFGDFMRAHLTLLQIMTFDGWIDNLTRTMLLDYKMREATQGWTHDDVLTRQTGILFYMISYCILGGLVLMNVVLAILVESFTEAKQQVAIDKEKARARELLTAPISEPLEGLIKEWAEIDDPELRDKAIESIFKRMDVNKDNALSLPELQEGLWGLGSEPRNQLSDEDFERYTRERSLCNQHGLLTCDGFVEMVHALLLDYEQAVGAWRNKKISLWDGTILWSLTGIDKSLKQKKGCWYWMHNFFIGPTEAEDQEEDEVEEQRHRRRSSVELGGSIKLTKQIWA